MSFLSGDNVFSPLADTTGSYVLKVSLVLVISILALGVIVLIIRHKSLGQDRDGSRGPVYSLHELREMLQDGVITQEEFDRLRGVISDQTRKAADEMTERKPADRKDSGGG